MQIKNYRGGHIVNIECKRLGWRRSALATWAIFPWMVVKEVLQGQVKYLLQLRGKVPGTGRDEMSIPRSHGDWSLQKTELGVGDVACSNIPLTLTEAAEVTGVNGEGQENYL